MARKAFYFDSSRCVSCKTCQVACKKKNDLAIGVTFRKVDSFEVGEFPSARMYHWSHTCNHCLDAECVRVCPVGAMHRDEEDGTVQHDDDLCIGCEACVKACPYSVPVYLPEKKITAKCNACIDTRVEDGLPTCVAACGMRALDFGEYDELVARHPEAMNKLACMPEPTTNPSVLIDAMDYALAEGYRTLRL